MNNYTIESISEVLEFIESNLQQPINLTQLAAHIHYSFFHFCKMFNSCVEISPYNYLIKRRLAQAAQEIMQSKRKIIEISADYQFNSPEVFIKAYNRIFRIQPSKSRINKIPNFLLFPKLTKAHLVLFAGKSLRDFKIRRIKFPNFYIINSFHKNEISLSKALLPEEYYEYFYYDRANRLQKYICLIESCEYSPVIEVEEREYLVFSHSIESQPLALDYFFFIWKENARLEKRYYIFKRKTNQSMEFYLPLKK